MQESHSTHRGGWQRTNTGYDFTGHPLKTRTVSHDEIAGDMTEHYTYYYDAWGRPLTMLLALNNYTPSVIHNYLYDGAGRLISDGRNGNANLATTYAYNVRSWLTDIWVGGNANQGTLGETFTETLYYQTSRSQHPQDSLQWAGNISAMDWMAGSDGVVRRYDFAYDGLSRLTGASYGDSSNGTGLYNRAYTYSGMKLQAKEESQILPLPGQQDNSARTDYVGNLIYDRTSLKKVLFPGGYAEASGNSWLYRFFVTDHLGNNRLVLDATGAMSDVNHYGPYGESLTAGAATGSGNPYKWGGKEYVGELDSYDFGARYYTTSIPRWTTMDPLCEKYYSISPYAYCAGNPVNLMDPDGTEFTKESMATVRTFERAIQRRIHRAEKQIARLERRMAKREAAGKSTESLQKSIENYQGIINEMAVTQTELNELKASSQTYDVKKGAIVDPEGSELYGGTTYDLGSGHIIVYLYKYLIDDIGTIAHEFKHLYQFEKGRIGFTKKSNNVIVPSLALYDITDEQEAHARGIYFRGGAMNSDYYSKLPKIELSIQDSWSVEEIGDYSTGQNTVFRYNGVTYVPW